MKIDILIPTCKDKHSEEIQSLTSEIQKNTLEDHRIILSGFQVSAALNRNFLHKHAESKIVVMMDDDVKGFYPGWIQDLVVPLDSPEIKLSSARYLKPDGITPAHMMSGNYDMDTPLIQVKKCPTACFAYRKDDLDALKGFHNQKCKPFDERFKGSGWEDDALCYDMTKKYPGCRFVITNRCKLIHLNEMKNQHTNGYFQSNKKLYLQSRKIL